MPEVKKIFVSRPVVTKPRQYLLDKKGDALSLLGIEPRDSRRDRSA